MLPTRTGRYLARSAINHMPPWCYNSAGGMNTPLLNLPLGSYVRLTCRSRSQFPSKTAGRSWFGSKKLARKSPGGCGPPRMRPGACCSISRAAACTAGSSPLSFTEPPVLSWRTCCRPLAPWGHAVAPGEPDEQNAGACMTSSSAKVPKAKSGWLVATSTYQSRARTRNSGSGSGTNAASRNVCVRP